MRPGVWLWAIPMLATALLAGACSGGYPLEPTRCDDWCDATRGPLECYDEYDPAGCVSQCEAQQLDHEECRSEYDAAVTCYRTTPGATEPVCYSNYNPDPSGLSPSPRSPCEGPRQALLICAGTQLQIEDILR